MEELSNKSLKPIVLKTMLGYDYYDFDEIIMFKSDGHNSLCFTVDSDTPIKILHSISYIEKKYLNERFFRCNRSSIINLRFTKNLEVKTHKLHLKNNMEVKVSEECLKSLKEISMNQKDSNSNKIFHENQNDQTSKKMNAYNHFLRLFIRNSIYNKLRKIFLRINLLNFTIILVFGITRCESADRFYRPNLPEKLCTIGIIDVDDTTLRHISFERSFQSEYPDEVNDSLREFSFTISSSDGELFNYQCDSTIKNLKNLRIPDNVSFVPREKYFLSAKEKYTPVISAEIIGTEPPSEPKVISTRIERSTLSKPISCRDEINVGSAIINFSFEKDQNLYYAILVKGWGFSLSSSWAPWPGYLDFSVKEANTPGFFAEIQGLIMYHHVCDDLSRTTEESPVYAYFIEGEKISGSRCLITLSIQYNDGYCVYDAFKALGIKIISVPKDLYLFEKSLSTYKKTSQDPFSEPVYLGGNIKGGNGIFAICRSTDIKITFSHMI